MKYKLEFIKISPENKFAGVGFAGNIFIILNALTYMSPDDSLFVDMETNECACTQTDDLILNTKNCWEYYFDQITIKPDETFHYLNSLIPANIHYDDKNFFLDPSKFVNLKQSFFNSFKLKENVSTEIDNFYNTKIQNKCTLGVQIRLTDMKHYHGVASTGVYIQKINEILNLNPDIQQIFVATDDIRVIDELKTNIKVPIVYYEDMYRANDINPHLHPYDRFTDSRKHHRYILGVECLKEIFTLSKCDYMLKADVSSISIIASIFAENIKKVYRL
jgi:hypothetical protein